jgi:TrmH family RNA methyltransferase
MDLSREKAKLVERLRNPRFRPREGHFLVEGIRGVRETLGASLSLEVRFAVASPRLTSSQAGSAVQASLDGAGFPVVRVTDAKLGELSDTENHQGVLLVAREPTNAMTLLEGHEPTRVLLLDQIQDPGNAGNLIRAAWAFGLTGVVVLDGTVDVWNPKVVRASAGALAHIPVARLPGAETSPWLGERGLELLVADAGGEDLGGVRPGGSWALTVGNEGMGVRKEILGRAARVLAIPMAGGADSLNAGAAGAIFLYSLCSPPGGPRANAGQPTEV